MLIRHSALYFLARGVPGLISFLAIAVYTRLLPPGDYGKYTLVVASVGLLNVVFFQWLRLALARFYPAELNDTRALLSTILLAFSGIALVTGGVGWVVALLWPDEAWRGLIAIAIPLLWVQAWFELNLSLAATRLEPVRFGWMSGLKSTIALAIGASLVLLGLGPYGPLCGLLLALLSAGLLGARGRWPAARWVVDKEQFSRLASYGLPLTATFALGFVISASDRFILAAYLGSSAVGLYAAGYDIANQGLTVLMMVVNLAAYPLLVRTLESKGILATQEQAVKSGTLLLGVSLPAAVSVVLLAPSIVQVVLGDSFREAGRLLLPLIAAATFLAGLKAYHFDLAFQLGRWTVGQFWVSAIAAVVNVLLNLWWIPALGILGAAWATLVAYAVAFSLSVVVGRKVFVMPIPWRSLWKIIIATTLMSIVVLMVPGEVGVTLLAMQAIAATMTYVLAIACLNFSWVFRIYRHFSKETGV